LSGIAGSHWRCWQQDSRLAAKRNAERYIIGLEVPSSDTPLVALATTYHCKTAQLGFRLQSGVNRCLDTTC
jgi:hypothetical protein